jgi:hypothetical protein
MSSKEKLGEVVALWPTIMKVRMLHGMSTRIQTSFGGTGSADSYENDYHIREVLKEQG